MKTFELNGTVRKDFGKKATKAYRAQGLVPCVLYGNGENVAFTVSQSDVRKLIYTPNVYIVNLTVDGKTQTAIIQELQFGPVSDLLLHIDFLVVSEKKPCVMELPVKLSGLAEGVKAGGKLSQEVRKLKVKALYTKLPDIIDIDVTNLGLGKRIQVSDVQVDGLEFINPKDMMVAQVKATRASKSE